MSFVEQCLLHTDEAAVTFVAVSSLLSLTLPILLRTEPRSLQSSPPSSKLLYVYAYICLVDTLCFKTEGRRFEFG
jgi:hypothetical protein